MNPPPLTSLIPHQGAMCLLERVLEWNATHIALESTTHRSLTNPLRREGRLRAVHLCEYGAQAMAVHGALLAQAAGGQAPPGMLVSLRDVAFHRDYIEDLAHALRIEAQQLHATDSSQQYSFRVLHENELLCEGRAAVMLEERGATTKNTRITKIRES